MVCQIRVSLNELHCLALEGVIDASQALLEGLGEHLDLAAHEANVAVTLADEAEDEAVDRLRHVHRVVVLDKQGLQLIVIESLVAKLDILVADVGKDGCLRVQVVFTTGLRHDTSLDVAKEAEVDMTKLD